MNEKIRNFLKEIGLSDKESLVYLALLPVDGASVIDLSKSTGINRTTLYPVLEDLKAKNLIIEVKQDKKIRFQAEPPERFETFIQNQKSRLDEQTKILEDVIPEMKGVVRQTGERPIIRVYEGREGILKSLEHYYEGGGSKEEYMIYPRDAIKGLFSPAEQKRAQQSRLGREVHMTSIFTSSEDYPSNNLATRYRIDSEKYPVSCEIGLYADQIHIHILSDNMSAVDIKSKDLAETLRTLFKLATRGIEAEKSEQQKKLA